MKGTGKNIWQELKKTEVEIKRERERGKNENEMNQRKARR
jgi:hypothetical protein